MTKPTEQCPADVVERAQAALDGATEEPWVACNTGDSCQVLAIGTVIAREMTAEDSIFCAYARSLVPELVAELRATRAELALTRDGLDVRPMTECESNLMTQVLNLRRELAAVRGSVGEVQHP